MSIDASVFRRWIQAAIVIGVVLVTVALILPAIQQAREGARRSQSRNNLKGIGLALSNYHAQTGMLPYGGIFDKEGTPFNGWTTALDPYLAQLPYFSFPDPNF